VGPPADLLAIKPAIDALPARGEAAQEQLLPVAGVDRFFAADQGDAQAQCLLGRMYRNANGVERDYTEAVRLFRLAADSGHAQARPHLGWMYWGGWGVTEDPEEALRWYHRAAEHGWWSADEAIQQLQYDLGWQYELGCCGRPKEIDEAIRWYGLAAEQGSDEVVQALKRLRRPKRKKK
jgi:hypothetical protein